MKITLDHEDNAVVTQFSARCGFGLSSSLPLDPFRVQNLEDGPMAIVTAVRITPHLYIRHEFRPLGKGTTLSLGHQLIMAIIRIMG